MMEPTVEREESDSKGRHRVALEGGDAELTCSRAGEARIVIDHAFVPDARRGEGLGEAVVARAVADARVEGRRIVPLRPFARAEIARHAEWRGMLD